MQHRSSYSHNRSVLPFGHPILLWVMGCRQFPFNTFCSTEVFKLLGDILSTVVAMQGFYFISRFFLCQGFKLTKPQEGLILLLHKVDPTSTRKIINKNNIVPLFSGGGYREWSTNICVNSLQDCSSSTILILKGRFRILTQGTIFSCIRLLQFSLGKFGRNMLHDLQRSMVKMTQYNMPQLTNVSTLHLLFFYAQGNTIFCI